MAWLVFFALVIAVPIALLVWRRRGTGPGEDGTDPLAHRNYAANGGPTPHYGGAGAGTQDAGSGT